MTSPIQSASVPLSSIFDPYVSGTIKARATGIFENGVDICNLYANIIYGSAASVTDIESENADLNTLFAKIGTASYSLPIDGTVYSQNVVIPHAGSGNASLQFQIFSSGTSWLVAGSGGGGTLTPSAGTRVSGSVPTGSATVKYTTAITSGSGGTVSNGAISATSVTSNPIVSITQNGTGTGPGNDVRYSVLIEFRNSGGTVISSTTIYFDVSYEGSA